MKSKLPMPALTERLSDQSWAYFDSLDEAGKERVKELVHYVRKYPGVDDVRIHPAVIDGKSFHVLVEADYTIYFRPEGKTAWIDLIQVTKPEVRKLAYA